MDDTPNTLTDADRIALMGTWLQTVPKTPRDTYIARIAPWRHAFADAIVKGYTWKQLATEIAPRPEIGVTTTAGVLRKCVRLAFERVGEAMPRGVGGRRRRFSSKRFAEMLKRREAAKAAATATTAATPVATAAQ